MWAQSLPKHLPIIISLCSFVMSGVAFLLSRRAEARAIKRDYVALMNEAEGATFNWRNLRFILNQQLFKDGFE